MWAGARIAEPSLHFSARLLTTGRSLPLPNNGHKKTGIEPVFLLGCP